MPRKGEVVTMTRRSPGRHTLRGRRLRAWLKTIVAILCAVSVLIMSIGSASRAVAADDWETWPRKKPLPPGLTPVPEPDAFDSARTVEAEKEEQLRTSSNRIWWVAAGVAVAIGIAIAAGSSGGGGGGGPSPNPGHN